MKTEIPSLQKTDVIALIDLFESLTIDDSENLRLYNLYTRLKKYIDPSWIETPDRLHALKLIKLNLFDEYIDLRIEENKKRKKK